MDKESLQAELDAAYKKLDKADNQIKSLLIERKQSQMVIQLLDAGNFIADGKLQEARDFVQSFYTA